ncbi:hypothetical protein DSM107133_02987 [Pseudosulfitobacter sp. DSM 107133]|nr:hypothetical protein DSM107133_02987 [Pseudosulfitobacter sp. DSM 107133]
MLLGEFLPTEQSVMGSLGVIFHGGHGQIYDEPSTPRHPTKHFIKLIPSQDTRIFPKLHFKMCFGVINMKSRGDASQSVTYEIPDHERFFKHSDQAIAKVRPKWTDIIRLFDRQRPHIDRPRYAMNRFGLLLCEQIFNCFIKRLFDTRPKKHE